MAKNFPYFKFIATEWLTGDIVFESLELQGFFINICALYWQRDGKLSIEDINTRYKKPDLLRSLSDRYLSPKDGYISIKFLDEQLVQAGHISKVNSENGKLGGKAKANKRLKKVTTAKRPLSDRLANRSKEEEEEEEEKEKKIGFLVFWGLYNKKEDRATAEKKWMKLTIGEHNKIIATLPTFLAGIKDKQYQPLPATYLNKRRWEDEISTPIKSIEDRTYVPPIEGN